MQTIFPSEEKMYNLRKNRDFKEENVRTTYFGTETLRYRGPKTWDLVPEDIKSASELFEFKRKIKTWKPEGCTCRMCKVFIPNFGFL